MLYNLIKNQISKPSNSMKKLLLFIPIFFLFLLTANATDYYIAANGNDANNGTSQSNPWKTLGKLNAYFSKLQPGDKILFRRGDSFYGYISVNKSGTAGSPITLGAYGSGNKPIISGFTNVSSWTNLGGNIWESSSAVSNLSYTNMVLVNNQNTAMGRWPNNGYATYDNRSGNTSLTSKMLSGTNWSGAEVAVFTTPYRISRFNIVSQSGNTLNYNEPSKAPIWQTPGSFYIPNFVIQNHPRTLDVDNEWYYNSNTKKLQVYHISKPGTIRVASAENLVNLGHKNHHVYFENLFFEGSAANAIDIGNSSYTSFQNCDFKNIGRDAINGGNWGSNLPGLVINNCSFDQINNAGIDLSRWFIGAEITNNTVTNVGMLVSMIGDGSSSIGMGISAVATGVKIENNLIENTAYIGIHFRGSNTIVKNNYVKNFCFGEGIKDGGGIYTWNKDPNFKNTSGVKIIGNIVANSGRYSKGIDLDDGAHGIEITGNFIVNTERGIYLHNSKNVKIDGNTTFDNHQMGLSVVRDVADLETNNIDIKNNIFFAKDIDEQTAWFLRINTTNSPNFTSNNNYFAKPISDYKVILKYDGPLGADIKEYWSYPTLAQFSKATGHDKNSKIEPKSITNVNELRFEYNATKQSKTIQLDGRYIDVKNVTYNGSVTLAPFTSVVLIRNGAIQNTVPTVTVGPNQSISLPTSSVTLTGETSDVDGSVVAYSWSKLSGPISASFSNPKNIVTEVNGLTEGVYKFELKVTDNAGASSSAVVQVTVNEAKYNMPIANAGDDQIIYLPAEKVILWGDQSTYSGKGDLSYKWSKISGPAGQSFTRVSSSVTDVLGLVKGEYIFQLEVRNQNGDSDIATVKVTVTQKNGLLPAVEAGNLVSGLKYNYYEDDRYEVIPDFSFYAPKKTGNVKTFDNSIANREDAFAINFSGYINIPVDGDYTFYTFSDDGSDLYIDGIKVVENDGIHFNREKSGIIGLAAGMHEISVGYFQQTGGKLLKISYSSAKIPKSEIPSSLLFRKVSDGLLPSVNPGKVLRGVEFDYFENDNYTVLPDFSKLTPKKSGVVNTFENSIAQRDDAFSINFNGYIEVPSDGIYTFSTLSDDGSSLFIDGIKVVDNDGIHYNREISGTIGLQSGLHSISVGYFQQTGGKILSVSFSGPGFSKRNIPASQLYRKSPNGLMPSVEPGTIINGLDYEYHEAPNYYLIPDFTTSTPLKTGVVKSFDNSISERSESFAIKFQGYINVPSDGQYTFYTMSDDGSSLYIDGLKIIDNDGIHFNREISGEIGLKAGLHAISVGYFQQNGGKLLKVSYAGPGLNKSVIPANVLYKLDKNSGAFAGRTAYMSTNPMGRIENDAFGTLEVKAYPNPFINTLQINVSSIKIPYKLELVDVMGRIVASREGSGKYVETLNVSSFQKGLYFLRVIYGDRVKIVKLEK